MACAGRACGGSCWWRAAAWRRAHGADGARRRALNSFSESKRCVAVQRRAAALQSSKRGCARHCGAAAIALAWTAAHSSLCGGLSLRCRMCCCPPARQPVPSLLSTLVLGVPRSGIKHIRRCAGAGAIVGARRRRVVFAQGQRVVDVRRRHTVFAGSSVVRMLAWTGPSPCDSAVGLALATAQPLDQCRAADSAIVFSQTAARLSSRWRCCGKPCASGGAVVFARRRIPGCAQAGWLVVTLTIAHSSLHGWLVSSSLLSLLRSLLVAAVACVWCCTDAASVVVVERTGGASWLW